MCVSVSLLWNYHFWKAEMRSGPGLMGLDFSHVLRWRGSISALTSMEPTIHSTLGFPTKVEIDSPKKCVTRDIPI